MSLGEIHKILESDRIRIIEDSWDRDKFINDEVVDSVSWIIKSLSEGSVRVAQKVSGVWEVNEWVKKAILLSFKIKGGKNLNAGSSEIQWFDKLGSKFSGWEEKDFIHKKIRAVPPCHVREGSFIGNKTVLMPSFINIGAYVGENCMIDTWSTIGSCAQIGNGVHISGGVGIGGVIEPIGKSPVIIEDNCFIGARSEIAEGMIVESGAVISMGVYLGSSTKIVDRATGEIYIGRVPKNAVVVPGSLSCGGDLSMYCAVIAKFADQRTKDKTAINPDLREHNDKKTS